jgi:ribosomal protein S18 acetylase RimI-like enzyme
MSTLTFSPVTSPNDPLFSEWLDLYETAFPPNERMLVSTVLKTLKKKPGKNGPSQHLVALLDGENFVGMMMYETHPADNLALLWYLAIHPDLRSKGLGSTAYQQFVHSLDPALYKAIFYEVEIPKKSNLEEAERRIRFYQRNGAFLLGGIKYLQFVGWHQPPTPMHIMAHPLRKMTPQETFDTAQKAFGTALRKKGELALT